MAKLKLKILLCSALCLTVVFAPIALDFFPSGTSYAGSWWWEKPPRPDTPGPTPFFRINPDPKPGEQPAPVPEPATLLLFGCGAIGLVALRKKFKK